MTGVPGPTRGGLAEPFPVPADPARPTRVGFIDDHGVVVDGLELIVAATPGLEAVGAASTPEEAFRLLDDGRPDVMVVDVTLGAADGITLTRDLLARGAGLGVVILTMHEDAETVRQAVLAGAHGYVVKGARGDDLVDAIVAVARGQRYLHSSVTAAIIDDSIRWQRHGLALSPREREVLSLLASGRSPGQVGGSLGISVSTVRRHLANLATKLGVRGIAALREYALAHDIRRD